MLGHQGKYEGRDVSTRVMITEEGVREGVSTYIEEYE